MKHKLLFKFPSNFILVGSSKFLVQGVGEQTVLLVNYFAFHLKGQCHETLTPNIFCKKNTYLGPLSNRLKQLIIISFCSVVRFLSSKILAKIAGSYLF